MPANAANDDAPTEPQTCATDGEPWRAFAANRTTLDEPPQCDVSLAGAHREYLEATQRHQRAASPAEQRVWAGQVAKTKANLEPSLTNSGIAYELKANAKSLEANGAGASEIMQDTLRRGVELFELAPQCRGADGKPDPAKVMDHAMAASGRVLDGEAGLKSLKMAITIGAGDDHTRHMRDLVASMPQDAFHVPKDKSKGAKDLKPAYDDNTTTQASHTFNFVLAGYSVQNDALGAGVAQGGNVFHETVQGYNGATVEDYQASKHGIIAGAALRAARDRGGDTPVGEVAPAVLAGTFSTNPEHFNYEINGRRFEQGDTARYVSGVMQDDLAAMDPARGVVRASEGFWSAMRSIRGQIDALAGE